MVNVNRPFGVLRWSLYCQGEVGCADFNYCAIRFLNEKNRRMSCRCNVRCHCSLVKKKIGEWDKHFFVCYLVHGIVQIEHQFSRYCGMMEFGVKRTFRHCGKYSGANAVSRHIGDDNHCLIVRNFYHIKIVATDFRCRHSDSCRLAPIGLEPCWRLQWLLDSSGHGDFSFKPGTFLGFFSDNSQEKSVTGRKEKYRDDSKQRAANVDTVDLLLGKGEKVVRG